MTAFFARFHRYYNEGKPLLPVRFLLDIYERENDTSRSFLTPLPPGKTIITEPPPLGHGGVGLGQGAASAGPGHGGSQGGVAKMVVGSMPRSVQAA